MKEITPFAIFIPAKLDYYSYKPKYKSKSLTFEVKKDCLNKLVFEFAICPNDIINTKKKRIFCSSNRATIRNITSGDRHKLTPNNYFFKFSHYTLYVGVYCLQNPLKNKYSQFYHLYIKKLDWTKVAIKPT